LTHADGTVTRRLPAMIEKYRAIIEEKRRRREGEQPAT